MNYKGVDGRVYAHEELPVAPCTRRPTDKMLAQMEILDHMSMLEIYKMEQFLAGLPFKSLRRVPAKERERILEEYPLTYDATETRYTGSYEQVWTVITSKFPAESAKYKNYKACQYALKYGATEPCDWAPGSK